MNRSNFYLDQLVTEEQLDQAFGDVDTGIKNVVKDLTDKGAIGITSGLGVVPIDPASMSVTVGAGVAYQKNGDRTPVAADQTISLATDSEGASTTVSMVGQERWVSIFLLAARALSEPVTDGNEQSVIYRSEESFEFEVIQGVAAVEGTAVRPTLREDAILLADVRIYNGQTTVVAIDIKLNRTENLDIVGPSLQFILDEDQYRPVGVVRELSIYVALAYFTEVPIPPTDKVIVKPLAISIGHDDGGFLITEEAIIQSTGVGETDVIAFNLDTREVVARNVSGGVYPTNRDVILGSMTNDGTIAYPIYMPQRISTLNGMFDGFKWFTNPDNTVTIYPGRVTLFGREWVNPYARAINTLDPANWKGGTDPVITGRIYEWCYVYGIVNTGDDDLNRVEFLLTVSQPQWTNVPISGQLGEGVPSERNGVYLFAIKFDTSGPDPIITNAMSDGQQVHFNDIEASENQVLVDGSAGSFTQIDLAEIIPATATAVDLLITINSPIGSAGNITLASNASGNYPNVTRNFEGVASVNVTRRIRMPIAVEQKIYYMVSTASTTVSINVTGYSEDKRYPGNSASIPMGA